MATTTKKLRDNKAVYQELHNRDWLGHNGIRRVTNPGGTVSARIGNSGDLIKWINESRGSRNTMFGGVLPDDEAEKMIKFVQENDTCTDTYTMAYSYETPQVIHNRSTGAVYVTGANYGVTTGRHRGGFASALNGFYRDR